MSKTKNRSAGFRHYRFIYLLIILIAAYVGVQAFSLLKKDNTAYVLAESGDLQNVEQYTGIAVREEQVIQSEGTGVVEYYYPSNRHLSKGALVCSLIDNEYGDLLEEKMESLYRQMMNEIDEEEYTEDFRKIDETLSGQIAEFALNHSSGNFAEVYRLKSNLQNTMEQRSSLLAISRNVRVNALLEEQGVYRSQLESESVRVTLPAPGYICYTFDGYEGWTTDQIGSDFLDKYDGAYETISVNLQRIQEGRPLYRLITGSSWRIVFFAEEDRESRFGAGKEVSFYIDTRLVSGVVASSEKTDQGLKVVIEMQEYLEDYTNRRLLSLRFVQPGLTGLKIPAECVREKEYYRLADNYLYKSGNRTGVLVRGEKGDTFYAVDVAYEQTQDGVRYVYFQLPQGVSAGSWVLENGSNRIVELSEKQALPYVSIISGGYTVDKVVTILQSSDQYMIVTGIDLYDKVQIP